MNYKQIIAQKVASHIPQYSIINLGIGIPTLVPDYLGDSECYFHTENGMLGVSELKEGHLDPQLVNAGKLPVGEAIGASYFHSADSFAMIRGGHIDIAILGALQVDSKGRIANWAIPGKDIVGVGGAMDLLEGAKTIIVTMLHTSKDGDKKLLDECSFPITSERTADLIITERATFKWSTSGYELIEVTDGFTLEDIKESTALQYTVSDQLIKESAR